MVDRQDITERRQAFLALGQSEARFRAVWESSADAMALSDAQGTVLDANTAYLELYGYSYDEVVGHNFAVIFPESFREQANELYQLAFNSPEIPPAFESVIRRKDGTQRVVDSRIDFIEDAGSRVAMLSSVRDITDRTKYEDALRESEERFRQTFDNAPVGMALVGLDFRPFRVNQALCSFLGYSETELTKLTATELTYPEDLDTDREMAEHLLRGETPNYTIEKRYITKAGDIVWAQLSVAVMRDNEGNVLYALTMLEDITSRKKADAERLRVLASEQAARALAESAMRAQEELLLLVSHDLRNPIAVVKGVTQLLMKRINGNQPLDLAQLSKNMEQLRTAADRMESFIRDLSTPQHMQPGRQLSMRPERVDLVALARQVAASHQQQTERHQLQVEAEMPEVVGNWDPARLEQVLDNLISNAVKYSPGGGTVLIKIGYERTLYPETQKAGGVDFGSRGSELGNLPHAERAVIRVSDEGMGITPDDLPHVFEWYRRGANVRNIINGTGIGLAGARQIIEQHGGAIRVESQEGVGSTFTVVLPIVHPTLPALNQQQA